MHLFHPNEMLCMQSVGIDIVGSTLGCAPFLAHHMMVSSATMSLSYRIRMMSVNSFSSLLSS